VFGWIEEFIEKGNDDRKAVRWALAKAKSEGRIEEVFDAFAMYGVYPQWLDFSKGKPRNNNRREIMGLPLESDHDVLDTLTSNAAPGGGEKQGVTTPRSGYSFKIDYQSKIDEFFDQKYSDERGVFKSLRDMELRDVQRVGHAYWKRSKNMQKIFGMFNRLQSIMHEHNATSVAEIIQYMDIEQLQNLIDGNK